MESGFGQLGVSAHNVGEKAAKRMGGYLASGAVAGPYLADQLLIPFALAGGGSFTTVRPSEHSRTGSAFIAKFLDVTVDTEQVADGKYKLTVSRA